MMFLVVSGCSKSDDAPAPSPTYTVTFDSQSATVAASPTSKTVTSPATTVVTLPTPPTKTNYYFAGWWTGTNGTGTEFTATTAVTGNITVYAYWSASSVYTVTFDSDGGTAVGARHVTLPATTVVTLPTAPTKTGYIFGGWYTATSGGGTAFIATTTVGTSMTVYAQWTSYDYTVTYNSDGGSAVTAQHVISPETTVVTLPTAPTKASSTFAGWYTATSGGGTEFTATTTVTANITVYAKWSTNPVYTVTYDSQGGSAVDAQHVTLPATTVVTLPAAPTRESYTFGGWFTAVSGGGTAFIGTTTVTADITVYAKWTAIPGPFTQDDLTGTWRMNLLKTGNDTEWDRARITINSSGVATCLSVDASFSGGNVCPNPFDLKLTMNTSTGVITESGNHAVGGGGHMTMTSNKNFVVGTGTNGTTPNFSYQLAIAQKEVSGTSYIATDVQSKSFVYHMLQVGATNKWQYGTGSTDTAGGVNITSETDPSGTVVPGAQGTLSVDGNGVVTMSPDMGTYQGFLSADKKTIVGTFTEEGTKYRLMIIQITGQTYTAGPLPAGISAQHMLVVGVTPAPLWFHFTSTVASGGVITLSDWVSSNSGITNPGTTQHGSISASGTLTITEEPTFHGQVSDDGKFTVATQTVGTGDYSLHVSTK
jgi:uncharacterized repeat protein (TIGR02543 family)